MPLPAEQHHLVQDGELRGAVDQIRDLLATADDRVPRSQVADTLTTHANPGRTIPADAAPALADDLARLSAQPRRTPAHQRPPDRQPRRESRPGTDPRTRTPKEQREQEPEAGL